MCINWGYFPLDATLFPFKVATVFPPNNPDQFYRSWVWMQFLLTQRYMYLRAEFGHVCAITKDKWILNILFHERKSVIVNGLYIVQMNLPVQMFNKLIHSRGFLFLDDLIYHFLIHRPLSWCSYLRLSTCYQIFSLPEMQISLDCPILNCKGLPSKRRLTFLFLEFDVMHTIWLSPI